ncbi:BUD13 homolog [Daphnia carinata]|uniref:BUD13 homolog n=1 Tax=Daphnia carinata TaxID=120202 RepID=UPI00257BA4FA|nr:BUD13 homolog [Daphnia carinata]
MSAPLSKLEYLKKYMSSSKKEEEKKVKKKKLKPLLKAKGGIKIVDEEIDLRKIAAGYEKDEDHLDNQEDAPSIAGVLDERSEEMKTKQDFIESSKWKRLGIDENDGGKPISKLNTEQDVNLNRSRKPKKDSVVIRKPVVVKKERHDSDSDPSPPRKRHDSDSDPSPPRRKRHDSDSDPSPPRRNHHDLNSDTNPPRRSRKNSDQSPARKRKTSDSDQSPPRRSKASDSDQSPPRKHHNPDDDLSPPRRKKNSDSSPQRRIKRDPDGDLSPVRPNTSASRGGVSEKLTKTLDGKIAGLQTGRALREETEELRKREEEAFRKMDKSLTGQNATTAIRAGKMRQIEAKQQVEKEKAEKIAKLQEAYQKWNKGLKQGESQSTKLAEDVHEMSKPLARFAGDEDLERLLRDQDREGDPMAAYMAKKKAKSGDGKGKASRPVYRGPAAAPNRFAILPGYRWDGVDRSNGYEKMYFEKQNKAVAIAEEAYKWSVSDM